MSALYVATILAGAAISAIGFVGLALHYESPDAQAVRAFFRGVADSRQVSNTMKMSDGEWQINVRSLDDRGEPFSAVPTKLLLDLAERTRQHTPWTEIEVERQKKAVDRSEQINAIVAGAPRQ